MAAFADCRTGRYVRRGIGGCSERDASFGAQNPGTEPEQLILTTEAASGTSYVGQVVPFLAVFADIPLGTTSPLSVLIVDDGTAVRTKVMRTEVMTVDLHKMTTSLAN